MVRFLSFLALVATCLGLIALYPKSFHTAHKTVVLSHEIEHVAEVQGLENKFIYISGGLFSRVGAGGLGAPEVKTYSPTQFMRLVPRTERIYRSVGQFSDTSPHYGVKVQYWAFIENRAGLITYTHYYHYDEWGVSWFNDNQASFYNDVVTAWFILFLALAFFGGLMLIGAFFGAPPNDYGLYS